MSETWELQRERQTGGLYRLEADWVWDCLIWFIDRAHHQPEWLRARACVSHTELLMLRSSVSLSGRLVGCIFSGWNCEAACQKTDVRLASDGGGQAGHTKVLTWASRRRNWENFGVVYAPLTFCLLPQDSALWLSVAGRRGEGWWGWEVRCVHVGATGNMKISVCAESRVHISHPILLI